MTRVVTQLDSVEPLRLGFNQAQDKTRVVALFSPTCSGCSYGVAALKIFLGRHANDDRLAAFVIWMPMLAAADDAAFAALPCAFDDPRVVQFVDSGRLSGIGYMREAFPTLYRDALRGISAFPVRKELESLRGMLESAGRAQPEAVPLYAAALFYRAGATWKSEFPKPVRWIKQLAYFGGATLDGGTGAFWVNDPGRGIVITDWGRAIEEQFLTATAYPSPPALQE